MEVLIESPMDGDLTTQVIGLSCSPDGSGRERLDDDALESRTEHNESVASSYQIGGEQLERGRRLEQLPLEQQEPWWLHPLEQQEPWWLQQEPWWLHPLEQQEPWWPQQQFFNRGLASAAVNGGERMTGGNDGGVVHGDGKGNGFGGNYQEPSSASVNGELGATYERPSDDVRYVTTENGEVHFHMNSFVNVDGRVYTLTQEQHLNNLGSHQLINKVMLAITGQTGIALMVAALNDHSSPFPPAFYFVAAANTVGFITTMISMLLRTRRPWASGVLAKVGAVAGSSAIILAMGMALHVRHIWAFLFLCIIAAVAVPFGQT